MAFRTSKDLVIKIMDFNPSIDDLDPFMDAANQLVTELCAPAGYNAARLTSIETWLAAHFLAIRDPRYQSETIGAASATTAMQLGLNLGLTPFGQQAMFLDTNGSLAWIDKHISQGKRAKAGITWLGNKSMQRWNGYPWRFFSIFE